MKNSFCRICRGRFNLKYPPAAVDSKNKKLSSHAIAVRINESGEISDNICWDCEDTLLGFHKSIGEDNDEEEPVIVDDDEILYESLEKTRRIHSFSRKIEIIEICSSDSEHEERVTVPKKDDFVKVESACTVGHSLKINGGALVDKKTVAVKTNSLNEMNSSTAFKKDVFTRGKIVESMKCPICPYLSGVEYEVVFHIRHSHPQYTGEHLRFEQKEGDSTLTRRIIFVHLWTFFECKACGKIHDRFWPHRKHLTAHDRKNLKNGFDDQITLKNNEVFSPYDQMNIVQTSKRALDVIEDVRESKYRKTEKRVLRRTSKDNSSVEVIKTVAVSIPKSFQNTASKHQCQSVSKKSKARGLLRKQQLLQAKREKRRQKRAQDKKITNPVQVIPKPTFKMPQQPAPRALSVVKQFLHHPRFTCKLCAQTLTSFIGWNLHMMRVHFTVEFNTNPAVKNSPENVCKKCDKRFPSATYLRMHIRLSHRRKNRLIEINGNDNEEVCRQTVTPKKESKEEEQISDCSLLKCNGVLKPLIPTSTSAFLCQYCGMLFATLATMKLHASSHTRDGEVKRIFKIKPQA